MISEGGKVSCSHCTHKGTEAALSVQQTKQQRFCETEEFKDAMWTAYSLPSSINIRYEMNVVPVTTRGEIRLN